MDKHRSRFEHLSNELIQLIFEYLTPHELFHSSKKLNRRITTVLNHQPLCLPDNQHMTRDIYFDYLYSIIPKHISQMIYLHLAERYAPYAVELFRTELDLDELTWSNLKAVTIEDVPLGLFVTLLYDTTILSHIHSLSINASFRCFHYSEYREKAPDFTIIIPILTELPKLRSLYLRMNCNYNNTYLLGLELAYSDFIIHQHYSRPLRSRFLFI